MLSKRIFETDFTTALNEELERKNMTVKETLGTDRYPGIDAVQSDPWGAGPPAVNCQEDRFHP